MSDETYYTVLNVKETASASEIKTAYRDLIKQIHPDTIVNHAPYLRKIAEDKAKEITEAYTVLSNTSKRRDYDKQLAAYRNQNVPKAPPQPPSPTQQATSQSSSGYCNNCGASLYSSGFCPKCNNFVTPAPTPPQPKVILWLGYNWGPLMRWSREHPILALATPAILVLIIAAAVSGNDSPSQSALNCPPSQRVEVNGKFLCQQAPVQPSQAASNATIPPSAGYSVVSEEPATSKPTVSVSGTYSGTVHNQTVNLSSTFKAVIHQTKAGLLLGCMEVKPPLYGSGPLRGSIVGSHVNFVVTDITFEGEASKAGITGSYVVTRQAGNQSGNFRLTKQNLTNASYGCADGAVVKFDAVNEAPPKPKSVAKASAAMFAVVTGRYGATVYKRCAFLPTENVGRCNFGPEEVAELKQGDRVHILSPLTRAQSGDDIYKVRTQQGWEGWARAEDLTVEPQ